MSVLSQDVRYALRVLGRRPSVSVVAALTLALGIGATSAMFTVINAVLLEPLPYPDSDRVMRVMEVSETGGEMMVSNPNFEDLRDESRSFAYIAQYGGNDVAMLVHREALRASMAKVSPAFFDVIGVNPVIGRRFLPEERREEAPGVAVVSHRFWQQHLDGNTDLSRAAVRVDGDPVAIVGVMPPGFEFPFDAQLWTPLEQRPNRTTRTGRGAHAIGRLADGITVDQARAELSTIARRLKEQYGDDTWMVDAAVVPLQQQIVGQAQPALLIQLGAVGFLLMVACANVLNLLLAQAAARNRELAVRSALGAGRWRLARQFVTETWVIAAAGATLGLLIALWSTNVLRALEPPGLPRVGELRLGLPVLLFTAVLVIVVALVIGLVAAQRATSQSVPQALRAERGSSAAGTRRVQSGLVVLQVAVTIVLLVGTGLLVRSLMRLVDTAPGFRTSQVATIRLFQPPVPSTFGDPPAVGDPAKTRRGALLDRIIARLRTLPGVRDVGVVSRLPLAGAANGTFGILGPSERVEDIEGLQALFDDPSRTGSASYVAASDGYFRAMGIPLRRGRLFEARDTVDKPHVAVISESLARTRWPDRDPIGLRIEFGNMDSDLRPLTVVGIVGDVRLSGLDAPPPAVIYTCLRQRPQKGSTIVMHTEGNAADLAEPARHVVAALDPETPVEFRTMETVLARWLAWRRFVLVLLGVFATLALLLSVAGVYGALAYRVTERTREMGIRAALGANRTDLLGLVLGHGARLVGVGLVLGAALALALTGLLRSLLHGVSSWDPMTFLAAAVVLAAVALAASYVPARRATRVDPIVALRTE